MCIRTNSTLELLHEHCSIAVVDTACLSNEEFAMTRKQGIGATDTPVLLGLMQKFGKNKETLLKDKTTLEYTDADRAISELPQVRRGRELEPFILRKAEDILGCAPILKPDCTFRVIEHPFLLINYDGVSELGPVEVKAPNPNGDKYWAWDKNAEPKSNFTKIDILAHCQEVEQWYGFPSYYYAQLQHQLIGTPTDYGYLAALRDVPGKHWGIYLFKVARDEWLQKQIIIEGGLFWERVENQRAT